MTNHAPALEPRSEPRVCKRALSLKQLRTEKGAPFSRQYLARLEKADKFPRRIRLGYGRWAQIAWLEHEVDAWLDKRAAERGLDGLGHSAEQAGA